MVQAMEVIRNTAPVPLDDMSGTGGSAGGPPVVHTHAAPQARVAAPTMPSPSARDDRAPAGVASAFPTSPDPQRRLPAFSQAVPPLTPQSLLSPDVKPEMWVDDEGEISSSFEHSVEHSGSYSMSGSEWGRSGAMARESARAEAQGMLGSRSPVPPGGGRPLNRTPSPRQTSPYRSPSSSPPPSRFSPPLGSRPGAVVQGVGAREVSVPWEKPALGVPSSLRPPTLSPPNQPRRPSGGGGGGMLPSLQ